MLLHVWKAIDHTQLLCDFFCCWRRKIFFTHFLAVLRLLLDYKPLVILLDYNVLFSLSILLSQNKSIGFQQDFSDILGALLVEVHGKKLQNNCKSMKVCHICIFCCWHSWQPLFQSDIVELKAPSCVVNPRTDLQRYCPAQEGVEGWRVTLIQLSHSF